MKRIHFFILLILIPGSLVISQTRESDRLLQQSFESVYTNPDDAIKVAEHLIKSSEDLRQKAKAYSLNSLANYIKGNYDQTLINAFEARNLSSGKKDDFVFAQSSNLIADILEFLQLNREAKAYRVSVSTKDEFRGSHLNETQMLISRADNFFQNKQNLAAVYELEKALVHAKQINNPFLQLKIHQKLSANYLSLDNKQKYHEHNQEGQVLRKITTRIENNTSNTAHQLLNLEKDQLLSQTKSSYTNTFWILFSLAVFCILVKFMLVVRNRNKLKTYAALLNYLNKENSTEKVLPEAAAEKIQNDSPKPTLILKESENQILMDLQKFESSKRFISKDMSLGMLAAQLNTNTKYLSEVINRHKQKNFNSYINELRINYITEKIKTEPAYLNYKVSYLAEECGFASHSTFTTVFKSVVGVSPITFVDFVKNEIAKENEIIVYE